MVENLDDLEIINLKSVDKAARRLGKIHDIKDWEIIGGIEYRSSINIEKGYMKRSTTKLHSGITFRFFGEQGRTGSAYVSRMEDSVIENCIEEAIKMMRVSLPNPEYKGLAIFKRCQQNIIAPWDKSISSIQIEENEDIIQAFINQGKKDKRIKSISGHFAYGDNRMVLLNSNYVDVKEKQTYASISAEIVMEDFIKGKKENSNGSDGQAYNFYKDVEPDVVFDKAYKMACQGLEKTKIETKSYPVILTPSAVEKLFCESIIDGVNAQTVFEKESFLQDRLHTQIASKSLTIKDNPWLDGGMASSSYDAEGTPTKPIEIVSNGVLKAFMHNVYTANLFNTESTGHASRGFASPSVGIGPSNLIVEQGNTKLDELISDIKEGIYFQYSHDSPNIVTGDFSGLIMTGNLIKKGEITQGLQEALLGINLLELFKKIEDISIETERDGSIYLPYMKLSDVTISGAK